MADEPPRIEGEPAGPGRIPIPEDDEGLLAECRVDTFRSGGPGGQHQNRTESGVRLTHLPSGLVVVSRAERSQHRNRQAALRRLRRRLETLNEPPRPRIPTRVPAKEKRKRVDKKKRRGHLKKLRRPPDPDD